MGYKIPLFKKDEPIKVSLHYYFKNPHQKDVDNLAKFTLDAMQGIIYENDKMVYELHAFKHEALMHKYTVEVTTI